MTGRSTLSWVMLVCGCGAASVEVAPSPPPAVTPELAAAAARDLSAHVDPSEGLVLVVRVEDASDGEAPRRPSEHRCAEAVDALAAELATYLAQRREIGAPETWRCEGVRCELRGMMEYDPVRALRFGRAASGEVVVIGLDLYGDAAWDDARLAALRGSLDAEHAALAGRCPRGA